MMEQVALIILHEPICFEFESLLSKFGLSPCDDQNNLSMLCILMCMCVFSLDHYRAYVIKFISVLILQHRVDVLITSLSSRPLTTPNSSFFC